MSPSKFCQRVGSKSETRLFCTAKSEIYTAMFGDEIPPNDGICPKTMHVVLDGLDR